MKLRGGRRSLVALSALTVLVIGGIGWAFWPSDPPVRGQDQSITVVDGPGDDQRVTLDATFFPPVGGGKAPVVLLAHGFGGSKQSVRDPAERLARAGYAVLTWSARGFGRSTGQIALNSPDYEVKDVKQLIDWVAKRPEVRLDASGDPRVGIAGGSYGGAIALMAAAYDSRIDAIAPQITWYDLADALFPNATGQGPEGGVFKRMWAGLFFSRGGVPLTGAGQAPTTANASPQPDSAAQTNAAAQSPAGQSGTGQPGRGSPPTEEEVRCGRFLPAICDMYQEAAESGQATTKIVETLRRSSPISVQGKIKVPTLLIQGQHDSLFPLNHADANAKAIAATGAPVKVAWYAGGHDGGDDEVDWVADTTAEWFDHYLKPVTKATASTGAAFTVTRDGGRDPGTRRNVLVHATEGGYPGLTGTMSKTITLSGPEQRVANPPGGSPASISSVPGMGSLLGAAAGLAGNVSLSMDMPGQAATFESAPLATPLTVTGSSTATVKIHGTGDVTLFAKLYDASGAQQAVLPSSLVAPIRVKATEEGTDAKIALPAIDHRFDAGHRLRLVLTTTDLGYASPVAAAVYRVGLAAPELTVPSDPALTTPSTAPAWWTWGLPLASVVIAAGVLLVGRRRRTADDTDPALAGVPLQITGLTKKYGNGELAVDNLAFRIDQNQVLGLLGPNGAGKTTTLRMLMGLILPDAGEIRIFGRKVTPGAPVLSRLGSFVEGPGFLPHLSGRANLDLYWRATGRPAADAHMREALDIAGLGAALDRAVRTYSQGMRQRLAIAQAMLGLPDLLVLDEPTNGLDPPQIAEMRRVLTRYADGGRTVIVSSHLLAEVEQTCTHVVVMHRGRLVTTGPVSELLATSGVPDGSGNGSRARLEDVFMHLIGETV